MDLPACIRLPRLRRGEEQSAPPSAYWLWPGHGSAPAWAWRPDTYPLSPSQADAFLRDLESLSLADLEVMQHHLTSGKMTAEINFLTEMADLEQFASGAGKSDPARHAEVQAQKALLWRWHQEGNLREIARIEAHCNVVEQSIPSFFQESPVPGRPAAAAGEIARPSWRSTVANACLFIPPDMPILAEGEMAADLEESLDFAQISGPVKQAVAPLWQALGHTRPATAIYNVSRIWLVYQE